jgi:hypothetical protein
LAKENASVDRRGVSMATPSLIALSAILIRINYIDEGLSSLLTMMAHYFAGKVRGTDFSDARCRVKVVTGLSV